MFSSDAPWCEIRPTHASAKMVDTQFMSRKKEKWELGMSVKSRNEPRNIMYVSVCMGILCCISELAGHITGTYGLHSISHKC